MNCKLEVFLASSSDATETMLTVARLITKAGHVPRRWNERGLFEHRHYTWTPLVEICKGVDAAAFIMTPEDRDWYRDDRAADPIDNILTEYGLFSGLLGQKRIICYSTHRTDGFASKLPGVKVVNLRHSRECARETLAWLDQIASLVDETTRRRSAEQRSSGAIERGLKLLGSPRRKYDAQLKSQLASYLMQKQLGIPSVREQNTQLRINQRGDCEYRTRRKIRALYRPIQSVEHWAASDVAAKLDRIGFDLQCDSPGRSVERFVVEDLPLQKRVLFAFQPEIREGSELEYEVSWTWPRMFERLAKNEKDTWIEEIKSVAPVSDARIQFSLHPALPKLNWDDDLPRDENQRFGKEIAHDRDYRLYWCVLKNVPNGGKRFELDLVPARLSD